MGVILRHIYVNVGIALACGWYGLLDLLQREPWGGVVEIYKK